MFPPRQRVNVERGHLSLFDRKGSEMKQSVSWCSSCSKQFSCASSLRRHRDIFHTDKELPSCTICGKKFPTSYSLAIHIRSHTNIRQFVCPMCQKSYKHKKDLQRHRSYTCDATVSEK